MNDSKVTFVGIGFLVLCIALIGGVYFLNEELKTLKEQYNGLEDRRVNLEQDRNGLREQIKVFNDAFKILEGYNVRATSNDMDFYSQVQNKIQENQRNNEISIITQRQNGVNKDGRSSIALTLRGDYYSFLRILAGWRNLTTTVRVSQLSITASKTPQTSGEVQADVVLEAIVTAR